jgi:Transglutaminase-like superfamily
MLSRNGYTLQAEPLLDGDRGTAQTVDRIRALVEAGKKDPFVNRVTGTVLRKLRVPSFDDEGEVRAIFSFVVGSIRFQKDPEGKETLRPARTTLEWGFGDCDDINAILLPSMLGTAGYSTRLVTIASHPAAPDQFSHVYCEVFLRGRWIPLDAARSGTRFGSAPSRSYRKRVWALDSNAFQDIRGIAGIGHCGRGCVVRRRIARGSLGTHYRLGRHYHASALGQDGGFDWSAFQNVIDTAGKTTSSIITAARAPIAPYPVLFPSMPGYPTPPGYPTGVPPAGGITATGAISQQTLILGGAALLAVVLLARR